MPTNLHWHTSEYAPRPDDAAGPEPLRQRQRTHRRTRDAAHRGAGDARLVVQTLKAKPPTGSDAHNAGTGEKSGLGYEVTDSISMIGGYRALGVDYADGDFVFDVVQHGPILGAVFRF